MSLLPLDALPDDARVWCFGASEPIAASASDDLRRSMEDFLERWTAHRADLSAGFAWLHDRFLVVAVDESGTGASGCSIDALVEQVRSLEGVVGTSLLDSSPVWFRDERGEIRRVERAGFRDLARRGEVDERTTVFDLTVERLENVRSGSWEREAEESWHAVLL